MHKSYEELCALAATGQITGEAMKVLDQHVKECSSCRAFLEDLVPLKAHVTPVVAGSRTQSHIPPEGIRERFLQKAAAAGLELNPGLPMNVAEPGEISLPQLPSGFLRSDSRWRFSDSFATPRFAAPALAGVLCGVLGFAIARHESKPQPTQAVVAQAVQTPAPRDNQASAKIIALQQQNNDATSRLAALSADLTRAQAEKKQLAQQVASLAQRASTGDQFQQRFQEASTKLQEADARAAKLQSDFDSERSRAASSDAIALAQQKATQEANSKVANLESQLDRLQELDSGKGLAADLISARNLHIVDVYDTESNGERKRAFGRVFFVEGKSLVFYAYDLPDSRHGNKKVEFRVWGEQAGVSSVSINLGAMRTDNSSQGRWVLTCDDPKVLNRINAVYLTADANPRPDSQPRGTKLMYAFLGSPNHP
jgi:hypothetical protein